MNILHHIPVWVGFLFVGLVAVGVLQTFPRRRSLRSAMIVPIVMIVLSLYGVVSVFAQQPVAPVAWTAGVMVVVALSHAFGAWSGIAWSESERRLIVPGSWAPLALIVGLFCIRVGVNVIRGLNPGFFGDWHFAAMVGLVYGAFSGAFLSRGVAMMKVARQALLPSSAPERTVGLDATE